MNDPAFASIGALAGAFRSGAFSPVDLTGLFLDRIERLDPRFHSFITVLPEQAMAAARAAERELQEGVDRGPLHGIPFAVKDVVAVEGVPRTAGSRAFGELPSPEDATVVARMRKAGAVLLGTLNTHELQLGGTTEFPFGVPRNPWNPDRVTGGSSSGSAAALAAGLCTVTLGGDTGGSIRVPAAYCGLVGLRPTWGRVSRAGVMPAAWFLDCVGPFGRTVEDVAIALGAIAGGDGLDPTASDAPVPDYAEGLSKDVGPKLRVGVVGSFFENGGSAGAGEVWAKALATIEATEDLSGSVEIPLAEWTPWVHAAVVEPVAAATLAPGHYPRLDRNSRVRLLTGVALPKRYEALARHAAAAVRRDVMAALETFDILVAPAADTGAPLVEDPADRDPERDPDDAFGGGSGAAATLNRVFSFAGIPALSVPCGQDEDGMPLGLQIVGRPFREADVLKVAARFERARAWECVYPMSSGTRGEAERG